MWLVESEERVVGGGRARRWRESRGGKNPIVVSLGKFERGE
jgi:hypothetical protein